MSNLLSPHINFGKSSGVAPATYVGGGSTTVSGTSFTLTPTSMGLGVQVGDYMLVFVTSNLYYTSSYPGPLYDFGGSNQVNRDGWSVNSVGLGNTGQFAYCFHKQIDSNDFTSVNFGSFGASAVPISVSYVFYRNVVWAEVVEGSHIVSGTPTSFTLRSVNADSLSSGFVSYVTKSNTSDTATHTQPGSWTSRVVNNVASYYRSAVADYLPSVSTLTAPTWTTASASSNQGGFLVELFGAMPTSTKFVGFKDYYPGWLVNSAARQNFYVPSKISVGDMLIHWEPISSTNESAVSGGTGGWTTISQTWKYGYTFKLQWKIADSTDVSGGDLYVTNSSPGSGVGYNPKMFAYRGPTSITHIGTSYSTGDTDSTVPAVSGFVKNANHKGILTFCVDRDATVMTPETQSTYLTPPSGFRRRNAGGDMNPCATAVADRFTGYVDNTPLQWTGFGTSTYGQMMSVFEFT